MKEISRRHKMRICSPLRSSLPPSCQGQSVQLSKPPIPAAYYLDAQNVEYKAPET